MVDSGDIAGSSVTSTNSRCYKYEYREAHGFVHELLQPACMYAIILASRLLAPLRYACLQAVGEISQPTAKIHTLRRYRVLVISHRLS